MAKKTAVRRRDESGEFDNSAYENVRVSATFDLNEVSLSYAAELVAPGIKRTLRPISFMALILLVFAAWQFRDQQTFLIVPAIVVMALLFAWSNWNRLQTRVIRSSSLALADGPERMHVVVCDDAVHTESSSGKRETYPLSQLKTLHATDECLLAGFGRRRYVYVPRKALSEGRYRSLVEFLREKRGR